MLSPTRYVVYFVASLTATVALVVLLFAAHLNRPWWPHHYNREVVMAKRHLAQNTTGPTLWLQGGSATWFGYDEDLLATATGYEVVNLGFHAAFPTDFLFAEIETYARPGDMVLLSLEPAFFFREHYTTYAAEELTAWDPAFLRRLRLSRLPSFLRSIEWQKVLAGDLSYLGHLVSAPNSLEFLPPEQVIANFEQKLAGTYHGSVPAYYNYLDMDRYGGIHHRSAEPWRGESNYELNTPRPLSQQLQTDLTQLSQWCAQHDVQLRYAWVSMARNPGLNLQDPTVRQNLQALSALLDRLQIPQINSPQEAVLPLELFYDTDHHLTPAGATRRTRALLPHLPLVPRS